MEMRNTKIPPKGLVNLGNTCFYNSATQCLLATHQFQFYLQHAGKPFTFTVPECTVTIYEKNIHVHAAEIEVDFEKNTPFIKVFKEFINEYYSSRQLNPRHVFNEIAQRNLRFRGWHQQDSHELLRYLIDGLRQEEVDAIERGVKRHLNEFMREHGKIAEPHLTKRAYMNFGKPFLDRVFGGALLQIIRCSECKHDSVCFEPFLDLSVSIPKEHGNVPKLSKNQQKKFKKKQKKKKGKKFRTQNSVEDKKGKTEDEVANDEEDNLPNEDKDEENQIGEEKAEEDRDEEEKAGEEGTSNGASKSEEIVDENADVKDKEMSAETSSEEPSDESIAKLEFAHPLVEFKGQVGKNVEYALKRFTDLEDLRGANAYECEKCCLPENKKLGKREKTVFALKKYLLYTLPPILTLHLKRFEKSPAHGRMYTTKVSDHVDFPLVLDVAPYCSKMTEGVRKGQTKILYSLYGIVCHSGSLSGGHYISYVKSRNSIEHVEKFFANAGQFDASTIGDFRRYDEITCDAAAKSRTDDDMTEEQALASLDNSACWYYASDNSIHATTVDRVQSAEAYLLFYERFY